MIARFRTLFRPLRAEHIYLLFGAVFGTFLFLSTLAQHLSNLAPMTLKFGGIRSLEASCTAS